MKNDNCLYDNPPVEMHEPILSIPTCCGEPMTDIEVNGIWCWVCVEGCGWVERMVDGADDEVDDEDIE